jgi:uncharacterized membrane protein
VRELERKKRTMLRKTSSRDIESPPSYQFTAMDEIAQRAETKAPNTVRGAVVGVLIGAALGGPIGGIIGAMLGSIGGALIDEES